MTLECRLPNYARMGGPGGLALMHVGDGRYYRDAGRWTVTTMWRDGKLVCSDRKGPLAHAFGTELVECTRSEWAKDNRGYVPDCLA